MLSRVRFVWIFALLTLSACGFTPMYGANSESSIHSATQQLSNVDIAMIPDADGVFLRNTLIDHFYQNGYPKDPAYRLTVNKIDEQKTDLDITINAQATRKQILLKAAMSLTNIETGKVVLTRTVSAITSYNILDSQFTTHVAEQDVREAALSDLARQIENHTMLYFKR